MLRQVITTLFRKPADREDGRLMSQNNHLTEVWMPVSFTEHRGGSSEKVKQKKSINLANISWTGQAWGGDVFISFFQPFTGEQNQNVSLNKDTLV